MAVNEPKKRYRFGPFHLDVGQRLLWRGGKPVAMAPKAIHILCALVERHGEMVERDELMRRVWPNVFVEDGNLSVNVFALRKVLAEGFNGQPCIETISRRGYRFIAAVEEVNWEPGADGPEAQSPGEAGPRPGVAGEAAGLDRRATPNLPSPDSESPAGRSTRVALFSRRWAVILPSVAVALVLVFWIVKSRPARPDVRDVEQLTHFGLAIAVVTDGTRLYVEKNESGRYSLVELPVKGGEPVPISTPFQNTRLLDISTHRAELLVADYDTPGGPASVWTLPLAGGSPRRMGEISTLSAKWSPQGNRIAFLGDDQALWIANGDGSNIRKVLENGGMIETWSPDGGRVLFTRTNAATGGMSLWEVNADGTSLHAVFPNPGDATARWGEGENDGRWTPAGQYFLYRQAFNHKVGLWAFQEKPGLLQFHNHGPVEIYAAGFEIERSMALSPDGTQIFLVGSSVRHELVRYDPQSRGFVPILPGSTPATMVRWSPDGQFVAYTTWPEASLWRARADGSDRLQLTFPPMQAFSMAWSPDNEEIAFHALTPGKPGKICLIPAKGGTPKILLANEPSGEDVPNWSLDGKRLMFHRTQLDKAGNPISASICLLDLKTGQITELPGSDDMGPPAWSPDGRYVAAQSGDFSKLMLFDFETRKWTPIAMGGWIKNPLWTHDSRSVYFQDMKSGGEAPVYRYFVSQGRTELVDSLTRVVRANSESYLLKGLTPDDVPVAVVVQSNADVYALNINLP